MSDDRRSAFARVQLIVEVDTGSWGADCTLAQATKQAQESAVGLVRNLFIKREHEVRIVSVANVAVTFAEKGQ